MDEYLLIDDDRLAEKLEAFRKEQGLPTCEAAIRLLCKDKRLMRKFVETGDQKGPG